jgi:hypothetical protein
MTTQASGRLIEPVPSHQPNREALFWLSWWIAEKHLRAFGRVCLQNFEQSLDTGGRVEEFVMTDMPDLPERTDDRTAEDAGHDLSREMSRLHRG